MLIVKIGHVAPTSGAIVHLGKDNENGARMVIEELNASGMMIGGKPVTFELLVEDDAADLRMGTAAAQRLVDAKVNGVVVHLNSVTTIRASSIYLTRVCRKFLHPLPTPRTHARVLTRPSA